MVTNPLRSDVRLFDQYMAALDDVLTGEEIRSAVEELAVSIARIRIEMVSNAGNILRTADRAFTTYEQAFARYGTQASEAGRMLTLVLGLFAVACGLGGLTMLALGVWTAWAWAESATWAGSTLLVASALALIASRFKSTLLGHGIMTTDLSDVRLNLARDNLIGVISGTALVSEVRSRINAAREDKFAHAMAVVSSPGLSEVHDRSYHVSTGVAARLDGLLDRLAGASVGVAGPRGAGKSTLVRRYCEDLPGGGRTDLRCMVSAPVDYVAKDFVLHLFGVFCRSVIRYFTREQAKHRTDRSLLFSRALGFVRWLTLRFPLYILAPAATLHWRTEIVNATGISLIAIWAVAGPVLIVGIVSDVLLLARTLWAWRRNSPRRIPELAIADAKRNLDRCRHLQTHSTGWTGTVQLPVSVSGQAVRTFARAEQPLSYPEIVEQFRGFARRIARVMHQRGHRVCIGVDELDKIGSPEQAERFLNEIKGVFGVPYVYFIVSVSDDALTAFERRGLPLRDTFDSSFDEIVRVGPLPYVESRRLLHRRVIGLTEPYVALCHCLAGGLPRDLIRAARQVIEAAKHPAPENADELARTAAAIVAGEIHRKADAMNAALPSVYQDLRRFLHAVARGEYARSATLKILNEQPEAAADEPPDVIQLRRDFATYVYFCATIEEVFDERLDAGRMTAATAEESGPGSFDALAAARYVFARDTHLAWNSISGFRTAWGLEVRPAP
ncbi:hypothetical protein [Planobispora rosea]|uniref:hypothetical protein n=1 Tax=Planobispora rosea TaxID=35762 RepID=UPI00083A845C|nr:hypothetical protein [Planobispora rosea]